MLENGLIAGAHVTDQGRRVLERGKVMTDRLDSFPFIWCDSCQKIQRIIFDVLPTNKIPAEIICDECRSIIATLYAARHH